MTNYREILRLRSLGLNHSKIAESMGIARQAVVTALQRAQAQDLNWQAAESLSDKELAQRLTLSPPGKSSYCIFRSKKPTIPQRTDHCSETREPTMFTASPRVLFLTELLQPVFLPH